MGLWGGAGPSGWGASTGPGTAACAQRSVAVGRRRAGQGVDPRSSAAPPLPQALQNAGLPRHLSMICRRRLAAQPYLTKAIDKWIPRATSPASLSLARPALPCSVRWFAQWLQQITTTTWLPHPLQLRTEMSTHPKLRQLPRPQRNRPRDVARAERRRRDPGFLTRRPHRARRLLRTVARHRFPLLIDVELTLAPSPRPVLTSSSPSGRSGQGALSSASAGNRHRQRHRRRTSPAFASSRASRARMRTPAARPRQHET